MSCHVLKYPSREQKRTRLLFRGDATYCFGKKMSWVKEINTSSYEISDLNDVEFHWENPQMEANCVFRPRIHILFLPSAFNDLEMGGLAEDFSVLDEEADGRTLFQHLQCLTVLLKLPVCWELVVLEDEVKKRRNLCTGFSLYKFRVSVCLRIFTFKLQVSFWSRLFFQTNHTCVR